MYEKEEAALERQQTEKDLTSPISAKQLHSKICGLKCRCDALEERYNALFGIVQKSNRVLEDLVTVVTERDRLPMQYKIWDKPKKQEDRNKEWKKVARQTEIISWVVVAVSVISILLSIARIIL